MSDEQNAAQSTASEVPVPANPAKVETPADEVPAPSGTFASDPVAAEVVSSPLAAEEVADVQAPAPPVDVVAPIAEVPAALISAGAPDKSNSNLHDSAGKPKLQQNEAGEHEPITEAQLIGPRGTDAPLDALSETARASIAAKLAEKAKSTVTDAIDSTGKEQVAHDGAGNLEGPHPQNYGPRGTGAPKDTYR